LSIERLKVDEPGAVPFKDARSARVLCLDVPKSHTLREAEKGTVADLEEVPLLGGKSGEGLIGFPARSAPLEERLIDIVVIWTMAAADACRDEELIGPELEIVDVLAAAERRLSCSTNRPALHLKMGAPVSLSPPFICAGCFDVLGELGNDQVSRT